MLGQHAHKTGKNGMNRRDVLKTTGAMMISSQLPALAASGNWDRAKLAQAARAAAPWSRP